MKREAMTLIADGLVSAIRKHVHETREALENRIRADETVMSDMRDEIAKLSQKLDFAESAIEELQAKLLRRVA